MKTTTAKVKTTSEKEIAYNILKAKAIFVLGGNAGLVKTAENLGREDIANRRGGSKAVLSYLFAKVAKGRKIVPASEIASAITEYKSGEKNVELLRAIRGKNGVAANYDNYDGIAGVKSLIEKGLYVSFEDSSAK